MVESNLEKMKISDRHRVIFKNRIKRAQLNQILEGS